MKTVIVSTQFCKVCNREVKVYKPLYSFWLSRTVFLLDPRDGYYLEDKSE